MSTTPDFMTQLLQGSNGTDGSLYSPLMGLAAGLLAAGGPSRMPVSLGQALGQGLQTGQQFQSAGLQNAMQQLMLGRQQAYVRALMNGPPQNGGIPADTSAPQQQSQPQSDGLPQTPTSMAIDALASGKVTPDQARQMAQTPLEQLQQGSPNGNAIPISKDDADSLGTTIDNPLLRDPRISQPLWYAKMAAIGNDPQGQASWTAQARLQYDILANSPEYKAAVARETFLNTPQDLRQGGAIFDPLTRTWMAQNPRLPVGATLDSQGNVNLVPGATNAIFGSEQATARAGLFGKPATGIITSGPNTGAEYQSTVGDLTGRGGAGAITALPPAQSGGMADAGKAATDRANEAIEGQKDAQQQIAQLGQLETDLSALGTGPGKETQLAVNKGIASIAGFFGLQGYANTSLTNAAAARKTLVAMTAPAVRAMGAREPYQMVNFIKEGMASISNPEDANAIVTGMYRGLAEYKNDTGKFAGTWLNQNNGAGFQPGKGAWDSAWQNKADVSAYILENLPPFERDAIFKQAASNPQLAMELKRAQASASYLIQNGYLRDPNENNNE